MIIIAENKNIIQHHGVKGMRWGIRKDNYSANRQKAQKIVKTQSSLKTKTRSDVASAKWMSKSLPEKIGVTAFQAGAQIGAAYAIKKLLLKSDASFDINHAAKTIGIQLFGAANKEMQGQMVLKRYTKAGRRNYHRKQYKTFTPEVIIGGSASLALYTHRLYSSLFKAPKPKSRNVVGKDFVDEFVMKDTPNHNLDELRNIPGFNEWYDG